MIELFRKKYPPPGSAPGELRPAAVSPTAQVYCVVYDPTAVSARHCTCIRWHSRTS